jgi:copper(I)-binding protein
MRIPWPGVAAGVVAIAVGTAGLVRGSVPQSSGAASGPSSANPIVVTGAFVRPPLPPSKNAAVYFTVYNTTGKPDRLQAVTAAIGTDAVLHTAGMTNDPNGVVIPAKGHLALSVGHGHVMIEGVTTRLAPGQQVNVELDFENAGPVDVSAPVVPLGQPTPSGAPS